MADAIRKAFATANKVQPALFSASSKGACPACEGLGVIYTDLQHMDPVATRCEACEGRPVQLNSEQGAEAVQRTAKGDQGKV